MKYLEIPIEVNGSVEDARLETYILGYADREDYDQTAAHGCDLPGRRI